ncbi:hypothetical protein BDA99DRAFT_505451 [Phascolomyces articulosus]|uniref:Uncharacterized protein n=1 Tax=Phascolomyces articulosus TaxID=60185 RepID=A0AAD5KDH4_9FUNG|nr:hypothetical protein BDA99DRAFT_505451 [Phascolomyces articulosus]
MKFLLQILLVTFTLFSTVVLGVSNCYCTWDLAFLFKNTKECCETDHGTMNGNACQLAASNGDAAKKWKKCCVGSPQKLPILTTGICTEH